MNHNAQIARLQLVLSLTRREWINQYAGTAFGLLWTVLSPLLLMAIYTLVFTEFFAARWPGHESSSYFAMNLFLGLMIHTATANALNKSTTVIFAERGIISNVSFPSVTFIFSTVLSTIPQLLGSLVVLLGLLIAIGHEFSPVLLMLPIVVLPFYIALTGLCLIVSAASVYLRDIAMVMPFVTTAMLFMSPVFYTIEMIPAPYHQIVQLNFLTIPIELSRQLIINGTFIDLSLLAIYSVLSVISLLIGLAIYRKLSKGFMDVI
tara:strand:+ start:4906 stop:5694 length:789 start_codon:yes stop_codon:yes gene_type:complete